MKKRIFAIWLFVLIIVGLTACSTVSKDTVGTTESMVTTSGISTTVTTESTPTTAENTTEKEKSVSETTTQKSSSSNTTTTTKPAEQKSAGQTTTKKQSEATQKKIAQTTTKKQSETTPKKVDSQTTTANRSDTTKAVVTEKKETTTEKSFDINYWVSYAKNYAKSKGLNLDSSATACWDNPINANSKCIYLERDIQSRLNRYAKDDDITDVWIWAEEVSANSYQIYIGYA